MSTKEEFWSEQRHYFYIILFVFALLLRNTRIIVSECDNYTSHGSTFEVLFIRSNKKLRIQLHQKVLGTVSENIDRSVLYIESELLFKLVKILFFNFWALIDQQDIGVFALARIGKLTRG